MRGLALAGVLLLAPLAGCLQWYTEEGNVTDQGSPRPPPPLGQGVVLHVRSGIKDYTLAWPIPGQAFEFQAMYQEVSRIARNASEGWAVPVRDVEEQLGSPDFVEARFDGANAAGATPRGMDPDDVRFLLVKLSGNTSKATLYACDYRDRCSGFPLEDGLRMPLWQMAAHYGPEVIRYRVNGTQLADHVREHGWVNLSVPVDGWLNVSGVAVPTGQHTVSLRTPPAASRQDANGSVVETVLDPSRLNGTVSLDFGPDGVTGRSPGHTHQFRFEAVTLANGTTLQQVSLVPGIPTVQVHLISDEPAPVKVWMGPKLVLASSDGRGSSGLFEWGERAIVSVERNGMRLDTTQFVPLTLVSHLIVRVRPGEFDVERRLSEPASDADPPPAGCREPTREASQQYVYRGSFWTLAEGHHSGVEERRTVVARDLDTWSRLWAEHAAASEPPPPCPTVDFEHDMVLALFWGTTAERCGERAVVHRLTFDPPDANTTRGVGVDATVHGEWYERTLDPRYLGAPHDVEYACLSMVAHPFLFVRTPRVSGDVDFRIEDRLHVEWPAPTWDVSESWNYTYTENGDVVGWVRWTVEALEEVDGQSPAAYRIDEAQHWFADDDGNGVAPETRHRPIFLDVPSLNHVWNVCGEFGVMGPCAGRSPEWDFPLEEGKTWRRGCCGDVIVDLRHEATFHENVTIDGRAFENVWVLDQWRDGQRDTGHHEDVYDPAARWFAYRVTLVDDHEEPGVLLRPTRSWELTEHLRP